MPAPVVRTNHDELKQVGAEFGQMADATGTMLQTLRQHKEALANGGWKGKGAAAFLREMDGSVLPSVANLHKALDQAQRVAAQISARLRQAEQDAAAVLQDRTDLNANPAGGGGIGGFFRQVGGFFKGVGLGAWDTVTGLWQAVTNPVDTIKGLAYAVTHPGELWEAIQKPYSDAWARGDYGEAIGRGTFEVLSMIFPPGGGAAAKGGAKAADIASDVARVANTASDIARGADLAGDAARAGHVAGTISDAARAGARFAETSGDVVRLTDTWAVAEEAANIPAILDKSNNLARVGRSGENASQLIDDLAELNTHGSGDRLVLGKWEPHADSLPVDEVASRGGYIADAKANGGRWFETAPGQYDVLKGQGLQMDVNLRVLEREMQAGTSRVEFVGNNVDDLLQEADDLMTTGRTRESLNARYQEVLFLDENAANFGYVRDGNGWTYQPPATGGGSDALGRTVIGTGIVSGRDVGHGETDTP